MIAAIPRTASSVVPSARALVGTTSEISESGVTTRLRLLPPSMVAMAHRTSMYERMLTRRTEDCTHSFEREFAGTDGCGARPRSPYVEAIVTCAGGSVKSLRRAPESARRGASPPSRVRQIYLVGGGVGAVGLLPDGAPPPTSVGGDAAGGCSRFGFSPSLPLWPESLQPAAAPTRSASAKNVVRAFFMLRSSWGVPPLSFDLHRRCDLLTVPLLVFGDDHRARLQLGPGHLDRARNRERRSVVEGYGAAFHALDRPLDALVGVHLHRLLLF